MKSIQLSNMKTSLAALLILVALQPIFSQNENKMLKKAITVKTSNVNSVAGSSFEFFIGGGSFNPTSITADSLGFSPMSNLQGKIKFKPKKGWDGMISNQKNMHLNIVLSGGILLNESLPYSSVTEFKVSGASNSGLLTDFESSKKFSGYNFDVGPEVYFQTGDFDISGGIGFGFIKTIQKPVSIMQGVSTSAYPALIKIMSRPEIINSGFQMKPTFRISYTPSVVGIWVEASYLSGPGMTTRSTYLTPSGRMGADGYKIDQLLTGSETQIMRKNQFEAFGVNAGITLAIDKKKKPRPKPVGGQDDDCDGLITITEDITAENGHTVKRIITTQTTSTDSTGTLSTVKNNPLYKGTIKANNPLANNGNAERGAANPLSEGSNTGENPLYDGEKQVQTTPNCGGVTQKITHPDGTVEETTFACPDDAIYYRKQITTPKQTQGATFGEKTVEKATSGLKDTLKTQVRTAAPETTNELKTKHDTAKNSVGNIR